MHRTRTAVRCIHMPCRLHALVRPVRTRARPFSTRTLVRDQRPHKISAMGRLEGHARALELLNPALGAVLRHVVLVVLIERHAHELAVADGLGVRVLVAVSRGRAHDGRALRREEVVELAHRVAEVVAVAGLVAEAEDGDLLARKPMYSALI